MQRSLPFVRGVAVQRYLSAEEGLTDARQEKCGHWYVDMSLESDLPQNWSSTRRRDLRARCETDGLAPIVHGNFRVPYATEIDDLSRAATDYFRTELQLAHDLGAISIVVHGGAHVEPRPTRSGREATLERFIRVLETMVAEATDRGIELWLENLSHYPRYRPFSYVFTRYEDFAAVLTRIPAVRLILDIGHANVNQQLALPAFSAYASSIAALSLSNNDGGSDAHLSLDRGTFPMTDLVAAIDNAGWHGIIAFETRDEKVSNGLALLQGMWDKLKSADGEN